MDSNTLKGILLTMAGAICWGFSGTCGEYLFSQKNLDSSWLTVVRMIVAGILLILFGFNRYAYQFIGILKDKKDRLILIIFAICGLMTCQYTYLAAVEATNAGTATVLQYLEPILVMIFMCIWIKKFPTKKELITVIFAVFGVFLIATHGKIGSLAISLNGLFWGISAAITAAICSILPIKIIQKWGSTVVTGYSMLIGGIFLFFISGFWLVPVNLDIHSIIGISFISIFGTALAFTLFLKGLSYIGAVKGTIIASIEPVSAAIFSYLLLGTKFTYMDIIGFIFILSAVPILAYAKK